MLGDGWGEGVLGDRSGCVSAAITSTQLVHNIPTLDFLT